MSQINNANQEDNSMAKEEFKETFLRMPEEKRAYFDDVYTSIISGGNYDDAKEICGSELEEEEIRALYTLASNMISAERSSEAEGNIRQQLLRNCSAVSAVLPLLMECENAINQLRISREEVDAIFEQVAQGAVTGYENKDAVASYVQNIMFYVDMGELSADQLKELRKIAKMDITSKVMMAMELNSKSQWKELQEAYGKNDVEFIKSLFQG